MAVAVELHPAVVRFLACQPKRMLIGGEWVEAASGKTFNAFNPATGQALAQVAEADREDIDGAVRAARRAFDGAWAKVKPARAAVVAVPARRPAWLPPQQGTRTPGAGHRLRRPPDVVTPASAGR